MYKIDTICVCLPTMLINFFGSLMTGYESPEILRHKPFKTF